MVGRFCRQNVFRIRHMVNRLVYHARNQTNYAVVHAIPTVFPITIRTTQQSCLFLPANPRHILILGNLLLGNA